MDEPMDWELVIQIMLLMILASVLISSIVNTAKRKPGDRG